MTSPASLVMPLVLLRHKMQTWHRQTPCFRNSRLARLPFATGRSPSLRRKGAHLGRLDSSHCATFLLDFSYIPGPGPQSTKARGVTRSNLRSIRRLSLRAWNWKISTLVPPPCRHRILGLDAIFRWMRVKIARLFTSDGQLLHT